VQRVFGSYLDRVMARSSGELAGIMEMAQQMESSEFEGMFAGMSPEVYDVDTLVTHNLMRQYSKSIQYRLDTLRLGRQLGGEDAKQAIAPGQSPVLLAYAGGAEDLGGLYVREEEAKANRRNGVWFSGLGQWSHQDAEGGYAGFDFSPWGVAIGYDHCFNGALAVGVSGGYAEPGQEPWQRGDRELFRCGLRELFPEQRAFGKRALLRL
jgi:uncharacterized protein with beta-barrel porin domain